LIAAHFPLSAIALEALEKQSVNAYFRAFS